MKQIIIIFGVLCLGIWSLSCKENSEDSPSNQRELILEIKNISLLFSDSAVIKGRLEAPIQYDYDNGDRDFPDGILIDFFDENDAIKSSVKADKCFYEKDLDIYTLVNHVVLTDMEKNQTMTTELLYWKPAEKRIFTDKYVKIESEEEILEGIGLEADQDFKNYTILQPKGEALFEEE